MAAGRTAEVEAVYWQDLNQNRENGWALFGLMQSLRAQGKEEQAAVIERRFNAAWGRADVRLTASRFMSLEKTASVEGKHVGAVRLDADVKPMQ